MIPRRIASALRRQNWYTVGVEIMIVVLGVFNGACRGRKAGRQCIADGGVALLDVDHACRAADRERPDHRGHGAEGTDWAERVHFEPARIEPMTSTVSATSIAHLNFRKRLQLLAQGAGSCRT